MHTANLTTHTIGDLFQRAVEAITNSSRFGTVHTVIGDDGEERCGDTEIIFKAEPKESLEHFKRRINRHLQAGDAISWEFRNGDPTIARVIRTAQIAPEAMQRPGEPLAAYTGRVKAQVTARTQR